MLSRFFQKKPGAAPAADTIATVPLLSDNGNVDQQPTVAQRDSRFNITNFSIRSEFIYKFLKTFLTSPFALTFLINLLANIDSKDKKTSNLPDGITLSIGFSVALLFALGESYCHYAESRKFTREEPQALPELTNTQRAAVTLRFSSIVSADFGTFLASNIAYCTTFPSLRPYLIDDQASSTQAAIYISALMIILVGNIQEAINPATSWRKLNAKKAAKLAEREVALADPNNHPAATEDDHASTGAGFCINSEFMLKFLMISLTSPFGIYSLINKVTNVSMPVGLSVSAGLGLLFAGGEAYGQYGQSRLLTEDNHHESEVQQPLPTLSLQQGLAVGSHYASDVTVDFGTVLAANAGYCNTFPALRPYLLSNLSSGARAAVCSVTAAFCFWGNAQEARNAAVSLRELTLQDREEARARVSAV